MSSPRRTQPRRLGLSVRLAALLLLATLAPTIGLGAWSALRIQQQAQHETLRGSLELVRALGFGLDATLQDGRRAMEVVAALPDIADVSWTDDQLPALQQRLDRLSSRFPLLGRVTLLDAQGRPLAAEGTVDPALAGFAPELADNYGGYVSDVYTAPDTHTPHLFMVVEVRDAQLAKKGFLAATIDLDTLHAALAKALGPAAGEGPRLLIVDSRGRPIYPVDAFADDHHGLRRQHPAVDRVLSTLSEGHVTFTDAEGVEWLAVYKNIISFNRYRGVRWGIILQQPTAQAFASADIAARNTALIALAGALLATLLAFPLASWLTRALRRLGVLATDIGQAPDLAALPPVPDALLARRDEVGDLAHAMAAMLDDLRRSRAELEERHQALRRAERLSGVGLLAAGVAHEINNPLTTILGYAELLREDMDPDHPDRDAIALIADEAARVREIVRGLLDLSRRKAEPRPSELGAIAQRAAALAAAGLDLDGVALRLDLPERPVSVRADPQALLQILMNLLTNALDALRERSPLPADATITLSVAADPPALIVSDNGPGMPDEVRARAAEPFFTTKAAGKGTGLGLAIVASLVQDHDATLRLHSAPGQGTRVEIVWSPPPPRDEPPE